MKTFKSTSLIALLISIIFIAIFRLSNVVQYETSWDVLGYYVYLPATFIHHDPLLHDIGWLKEMNADGKLSGTLYMITQNNEGHFMYFFLMGTALFYLPFFLSGMLYASIGGYPVDGFSWPFQYFLVFGAVIYTVIGLIFLRKILKRYFNDNITAIVLLIIVFTTNYIHHLTLKNLETVNILFMLTTIVTWNTIKWHETFKAKHLIVTGISAALMTLVKPSEVFVVLIPLLWNVTSLQKLKEKIGIFYKERRALILTIFLSSLVFIPQLLYWHHMTGRFIYDSYKNPGIGLDFMTPHIWNVLFSFRKGWLIYTPVMVFSLIGFYFLYKRNREIFAATFGYFLVSFYILSSWTEWWYGAAYSCRPVITVYPVLAVALGYFIVFIHEKKIMVKTGFYIAVVLLTFMNQFQWWQLRHYILDPYRTTKEYYGATFLSTKIPDNAEDLKLVARSADGINVLKNPGHYQKKLFLLEDMSSDELRGNMTENSNDFYRIADQEFFPILELPYREITSQDHFWIKVTMDICFPDSVNSSFPCLVTTMERKGGSYNYYAPELTNDWSPGKWQTVNSWYLSPEIRNTKDVFKCYIWKRSKEPVDIDNLKVEIYTPKSRNY